MASAHVLSRSGKSPFPPVSELGYICVHVLLKGGRASLFFCVSPPPGIDLIYTLDHQILCAVGPSTCTTFFNFFFYLILYIVRGVYGTVQASQRGPRSPTRFMRWDRQWRTLR